MRHARMHLAAAELFGDRQSERFSIRSYGGGGKPSDGPTPIDLARGQAAARPMACLSIRHEVEPASIGGDL